MSNQLQLSFQLNLPKTPEYTTDPLQAAELQRIINSINIVANTLDTYTGRAPLSSDVASGLSVFSTLRSRYVDVVYGYADTDLPAGSAVHLTSNGDSYSVSLASAALSTTCCHGFIMNEQGVKAGSLCTVNIGGGLVPLIAGLVEHTTYYLSDTPGVINTAAGTVPQKLGYALGSTKFYFIPSVPD